MTFARAGCLQLLRDTLGQLTIPDAVYDDIVTLGAGKPGSADVSSATWIQGRSLRIHTLADKLPKKLHLGEREAIALAHELGAPLLVDEREARKEADRLGITYFGSLRVLKHAKEIEIIPEVKPVLDKLISSGSFISEQLYHHFLRQLGEK